MSPAERGFSVLGVVPGGGYLKAGKNILKGTKAMKIIQKVAKIKAIKMIKKVAKTKEMKIIKKVINKANSIQNIVKTTLKIKNIADEN